MYPELVTVGRVHITSFGVCLLLAFLVATYIVQVELRRKQRSTDEVWRSAGLTMIAGLIGAKVYYLALHWRPFGAGAWTGVPATSGFVWYGAFLGGLLPVIGYARRAKVPALVVGDALAPALALAYAIGRVGCFLIGDDYGLPTGLPWGVRFIKGPSPSTADVLRSEFSVAIPSDVAGDTVLAVHPTQLYEVLIMGLVFALLWTLRRRPWRAGTLFSIYLVLAGLERVLVEFLRAKDDRIFGAITIAQIIGLGSIVTGVLLMRLGGEGWKTSVSEEAGLRQRAAGSARNSGDASP